MLLSRALRPAGVLLSESHPLLGELADAQARAHAARGQHIPLTLEPFTSRALHLEGRKKELQPSNVKKYYIKIYLVYSKYKYRTIILLRLVLV